MILIRALRMDLTRSYETAADNKMSQLNGPISARRQFFRPKVVRRPLSAVDLGQLLPQHAVYARAERIGFEAPTSLDIFAGQSAGLGRHQYSSLTLFMLFYLPEL
jgi:hypothetical protein